MEKIIVSKASNFILDKYGEAAQDTFLDNLESQHDIEITDTENVPESSLEAPIAVGAISGE